QDVAVRVGGDRGQRAPARLPVDLEVSQEELVGEGLLDLSELLALAEGHRRTRRREGIGQDVVDVLAVPSVHVHFLVEDTWGDGEALRGIPAEGKARAGAVPVVHVLVDGEARLQRVR